MEQFEFKTRYTAGSLVGGVPGASAGKKYEQNKQKGGSHVVDDCRCTDNSVAAGAGDRLYDWLFYSHPAGHCHHHRAGQSHWGAETIIAILIRTNHSL